MIERRVFTYKDVEEAKGWIGKGGIFSDSLEDISNGIGHFGILDKVEDTDYHFCKQGSDYFQFFSPNPEPIEKWVPFTVEDWQLFHGKPVSMKAWNNKSYVAAATVIGWNDGDGGCVEIVDAMDSRNVPFEEFLKEWQFANGDPCGKKVIE